MNQQRLKAYLNLIQGLLSCPNGEEWILLRQHEDLVNPELVQVMEQVANHLVGEGHLKEAKFLHNWAGQLHHILTQTTPPSSSEDKSQDYVQLIQALLNCPKGSEEELLAANQELIGPGLVQAMKQVATKFKAEGDRETASFLDNLAGELNRAWVQAHGFQPPQKKPDTETEIASQQRQQLGEKLPQPPPTAKVGLTEMPSPPPAATVSPSVPGDTLLNQRIAEHLGAIADSLAKLDEVLASRMQASDPLWYMDVLERARASNWVLTTEEVEQLIGVKPHCPGDEDSYQRGCWVFVKSGKIGLQTAWRVQKEDNSPSG
jgi:hypothetical protein